jgi:hypothetical protein
MENILWFSCEPNGQYWVCIFAVCKVASYLSDHGTCYGVCAKLRRGRECLDLSISIASTLVKAYTTILEVHREDGMLPPHSRTRSLSTPPPAAAAVVAGSSVAAASTHLPTARLPPCLHLPTLSIRMPPPSRLLPPPPAEPVNSCWTNYFCKKRRRVPRPPPPPPWRSVHVDLVGHCFNWLRPDHVTAACSFVAHCLRCHREGHQARAYKRPQSPDAAGPLPRRPLIVVLNPLSADVALAEPKAAG